jgi:hypothetical protein
MERIIRLSVLVCLAAFAQDQQPAAVGGGHIPAHGPAAAKAAGPARDAAPAKVQRPNAFGESTTIAVDAPGHPNVPHVHANNDQWVGHDSGPGDPNYHLDRPWAHGRYTGGFGPKRVFGLAWDKVNLETAEWLSAVGGRTYFDNFYWFMAPHDLYTYARWKWAGDRIAIYEDPDHVGWYLGYNLRLGTIAHMEYLGTGAHGPKVAPEEESQRPENRKSPFENDQVIIHEAHAQMHVHRNNRVMIYGTRGGELLHSLDGSTNDLKWEAGEVKWSPASAIHYSEIPTTNEVGPQGPAGLDIGIKKPGDPSKAVSTALDPLRVDPKDFKLEFENPQVRVLRLKIGPRQSVPMHEYVLNRIVWYYKDQNVRETSPEGTAEVKQHKAGNWVWEGSPRRLRIDNLNDAPFEAIVVEFRN